jgi:hypothetical protein
MASATGREKGALLVYSAKEQVDNDPNLTEILWDENDGRIDILHVPAHTDYTISSLSGKVFTRVLNATGPDDPKPTLVTLRPGRYEVEAQAKTNAKDGETADVKIPVVVQSGKSTILHLEGDWKPAGHYSNSDVVRLPDGQIAGWRAPEAQPVAEGRFAQTGSYR